MKTREKVVARLFKKLSTREVEVLKLFLLARKNKEIAKELDINEKTVSTYKARLFKKLNVTNVVDLIHQAKHHDLTYSLTPTTFPSLRDNSIFNPR